MNYIGSKKKLSYFIKESIIKVVGNTLNKKIFCDLFAGTGIIGTSFKLDVKQVISNDIEYYSYVLNRNYIGNHKSFSFEHLIEELNQTDIKNGKIYRNYCPGSGSGRNYFSDENGMKIDAVRTKIDEWKNENLINSDTYFFLLASLIESADKVANTASVYGAFLKQLKKTAQNKLIIKPATFPINDNKHLVFNEDSNALIKNIEGDILYLDPPYNSRQYGANYHILNSIALYDDFEPAGKTGLRNYYKSKYCSHKTVKEEFRELIKNAKFKYIFLSYNNEGLMSLEDIKKIMKDFGKYDIIRTEYQRFKADKTENRNHKADKTSEFLHILEKHN